jgi:plastocyanin
VTDLPTPKRVGRHASALLVVMVGGLTLATGCSKGSEKAAAPKPAGNEQPAAAPAQPPAAAIAAAPVTIRLANLAIEQPAVTVPAGTKVVWSNAETNGVPHNIVSGMVQGTMAHPDAAFGSPALFNPGQSFEHTFASAGTFHYYCSVHPQQMQGTVTVS